MPKDLVESSKALQDEELRHKIRQLRLRGVTDPGEIGRFISKTRKYVIGQIQVIRRQDRNALKRDTRENSYADAIARLEKELALHGEIENRIFNKTIADPNKGTADADKNYVDRKMLRDLAASGEHIRNLLKDISELQGLGKDEDPGAKGAATTNNNSININIAGAQFSMDEVKSIIYEVLPNTEAMPLLTDEEQQGKVSDGPLVIDVTEEGKE